MLGQHPQDWFWVDAICIWQDDVEEKNRQVAQIDQVFIGAKDVWAWLGNDFMMESYISDYAKMRRWPKARENNQGLDAGLSRANYSHRTWIIQEAVFAKSLKLFAGKWASCSFDAIKADKLDRPIKTSAGLELLSLRAQYHASPPKYSSFIDLIWRFGRTQCLNPLDKVFALQSLTTQESRCKVDYRTSPEDLYWQVLTSVTTSCRYPEALAVASALKISFLEASSALEARNAEPWTRQLSIIFDHTTDPLLQFEDVVDSFDQSLGTLRVKGSEHTYRLALGCANDTDCLIFLQVTLDGGAYAVLRPIGFGPARHAVCGLFLRIYVPEVENKVVKWLSIHHSGLGLLHGLAGSRQDVLEVDYVTTETLYTFIRLSPRVLDDFCRWKQNLEKRAPTDHLRAWSWHGGYKSDLETLQAIKVKSLSSERPHSVDATAI